MSGHLGQPCGKPNILCMANEEELTALRSQVARYRGALEFYADVRQYAPCGGDPPGAEAVIIRGDRGHRARQALAGGK